MFAKAPAWLVLVAVVLALTTPFASACDGGIACGTNGCALEFPGSTCRDCPTEIQPQFNPCVQSSYIANGASCTAGALTNSCPSSCVGKSTSTTSINGATYTQCQCSYCGTLNTGGGNTLNTGGGNNGGGDQSCADQLSAEVCEKLGPLAALCASTFALFIIIFVVCVSTPCIAFAVAWCTCVSNKQTQGRSPTGGAWCGCCGVFWILVILGGMLFPPFYFVGSFVMLIPFCMDSCCACRLRRPSLARQPSRVHVAC